MTYRRDRVARHEAGHAAALIMGGRLPTKLTAASWPWNGLLHGQMEADWSDVEVVPHVAVEVAVAVLMGPLAAEEPGWPPEWSELDREAPGDLGQLSSALILLKTTEDDYKALVEDAKTLAGTAAFQRLVRLISRGLELKEELDAADLRQLIDERTLRAFNVDPEPTEEH